MGETGSQLARRLSTNWDVTVLDVAPAALEAPELELCQRHMGDGTSALVLRRAGAEQIKTLIYRVGELIVPHGDTVIEEGDRVLIVGEVGVRAGLALMLVFVALATLLGVEGILGAFVAGALFSFVFREKGILETKLSSIGFGFFVPFFFIWVGTNFDLSTVLDPRALVMVGQFLGLSLLAKILPSTLLLLAGFTLREVLASALLLGAPLTVLVAISRIGLDVKVIAPATASAVVLLAIVGGVLLPWAFRMLLRTRQ